MQRLHTLLTELAGIHPAWLHLTGYFAFLIGCVAVVLYVSKQPDDDNEPW